MAQAAAEMTLKLTVLSLVVLFAQGNGQYFRRFRYRDYEMKSDPVSMREFRSEGLPDFRSQILDNPSLRMNLRSPVARAFLVRGSASPMLRNIPMFPSFIHTFVSNDPDDENRQTSPFSGAYNPFASLFAVPNVIVISSANGLKPPTDRDLPEQQPSPEPSLEPEGSPARGNFEARSVLPPDGLRNFRFEDLLDY